MILTNDNDFETRGDTFIEVSPLEQLSRELLDEFITIQIQQPFEMKTNFVENFTEEVELLMLNNAEDEDYLEQIKTEAISFYTSVINQINDRFHLDIDEDVMAGLDFNGARNLCDGLYGFFTVDYTKNVAKYLSRIILLNSESIIEELSNNEKVKDVSTLALRQKIDSDVFASLLANINVVLSIAKDIGLDPLDFINLFNQDNYDVHIIKYCLDNHAINGNFVKPFLRLVFDNDQDYVYDGIVADVYTRLLQKYAEKHLNVQKEGETDGTEIEYADANDGN